MAKTGVKQFWQGVLILDKERYANAYSSIARLCYDDIHSPLSEPRGLKLCYIISPSWEVLNLIDAEM